jgi:hypothetical protein
MPRLRSVALLAAVLTSSASIGSIAAQAQTREDEQLWVNLTAMGSLKDDIVYFVEAQPRMGDGASRLDQLLLRAAVGVKLGSALTLYQGYGHIVVPVAGGRDINEERAFQQMNWTIGKVLGGELSSRTRIEERWRSDGGGMGVRVREMIRLEAPFQPGQGGKGLNALVYTEPFVALNDTGWGARAGFDQVRNFVGVEIPVGGASTVEAGYLNLLVDQAGPRRRMNHVASLTLFFRR